MRLLVAVAFLSFFLSFFLFFLSFDSAPFVAPGAFGFNLEIFREGVGGGETLSSHDDSIGVR